MQNLFIVAILALGFLITFQIAKASEYVAVLRGEEAPAPHALSALGNNLAVIKILDAARRSARTGRTVPFTGASA